MKFKNKKIFEEQSFRCSIEVPGVPRFLLTFDKSKFFTIRQFIHFICVQTGLSTGMTQRDKYILFLEDSIVLNMDAIRDGDRLTLVP